MLNTSYRRLSKIIASAVAAASLTALALPASACTGIILHSEDGAAIPARTMEFGFDIQSNIAVVPAGTEITTLSQIADKTGFSFKTKYGFVGSNGLGKAIVFDGVNEKGLYYGAFYFSGLAQFSDLTPENQNKAVSSEELGNWILGNFGSVAEVKAGLKNITVVSSYIKEIDSFAPFHYALTDASGESVVLEFTKQGLTIHDNDINVVTNNPTYDWHLTNLNNYIGLTVDNHEQVKVGNVTLTPFGQGTGLVGIPGDHSSPSRFVRAAAYANSVYPSKTAGDAVFQAFHVLNTFDIPKGSVREETPEGVATDYTIWTSAVDTKNPTYYYKTYLTQRVEKVNLKQALARVTKPTIIKMESGFSVTDRTADF